MAEAHLGPEERVVCGCAKKSELDSIGMRCTFEQSPLGAGLVDIGKGQLTVKTVGRENPDTKIGI